MSKGPAEKFTADKRLKALESYAEFGQKTKAAREAKVTAKTITRRIADDPEFKEQWEIAGNAFVEKGMQELHDRVFVGQLVEKFGRDGKIISSTYEKSDALLMFHLRAHAPKLYGDRKHIEHKSTVAHEHMLTLDVSKLSPTQMDHMRALLGDGSQEPTTPEPPSPEEPDGE